MIVRCSNCKTSYSVDDSKVRNKKFAFNCPKCETENIINNRADSSVPMPPRNTVDDDFGMDMGARQDGAFAESAEFHDPSPGTQEQGNDKSMVAADEDMGFSDDIDDLTRDNTATKPARNHDIDVPLDDLETNINLDDIDIDIASEKESDSREDTGFDGSDLIRDELDSMPAEDEKADNLVMDELAGDLEEKKDEDDFEDINVDDILIPDEESDSSVKKGSNEDRGDILDLEKDLIVDGDDGLSVEGEDLDLTDDIEAHTYTIDADETPREKKGSTTVEDDFSLDLGELDIELEGDAELMRDVRKSSVTGPGASDTEGKKPKKSDDDLTLDLDSLDIELDESGTLMEGENPDDADLIDLDILEDKPAAAGKSVSEEDLTLDLDALDITLEETDEVMEGVTPDDDEKLTLQDAGLSLEELSAEGVSGEGDEKEEEDIKLTLDDIDPSLSNDLDELTTDEIDSVIESEEDDIKLHLNEIDPDLNLDDMHTGDADDILVEDDSTDDALIIDEIDDLPEIDLDDTDTDSVVLAGKKAPPARPQNDGLFDEELIDINLDRDEFDEENPAPGKRLMDAKVRGSVVFSIDYSLKYSRIGALVRLLGLILLALLPHFIVFLVYTALSMILGFLNHLIVLIRGEAVEDFCQIQENTVRYCMSIYSSLIGVIEELPVFTGKDNIDHALQMRATYPLRNSRFLAGMRLSVIGVALILLPHILIAGVLSLVMPLMFIASTLSVLITGRMPSILFDFYTRYYRYCARILCFATGIIDDYPSFKFD